MRDAFGDRAERAQAVQAAAADDHEVGALGRLGQRVAGASWRSSCSPSVIAATSRSSTPLPPQATSGCSSASKRSAR